MRQTLDFIVIGAQKAGTTSLFEHLRTHPEISLPAGKEAPYFSHDAEVARGWTSYLDREFRTAPPHTRWGTVTTHYMAGGLYRRNDTEPRVPSTVHTVPERIRAEAPDVRLVAILRDPIERAVSHHAMNVLTGSDQRSLADAIRDCLRPSALELSRSFPAGTLGYLTWGEYGRILSGYLDTFPREQLLVIYLSDLARDPATLLGEVFTFLGVDDRDFVPPNLGRVYRRGSDQRLVEGLHQDRLRGLARRGFKDGIGRHVWTRLPQRSQATLKHRYERFLYLADLWNRRASSRAETNLDPELRSQMRALYREDSERLTTLLGDPPPWAS